MTEAEQLLWSWLRKRQVNGCRFRRQYSIKGFVLDFYSPELRLGIEVDGGYHRAKDQIDYDKARQRLVESLGIKFLRFKNEDVLADIEAVVKRISLAAIK